MSKYNYSIFPHFFWDALKADSNPAIVKTLLATKITNYIEAGLPIIVSEQCEYIADIVKKHGMGFVIKFNDLKNLRDIIKKHDYKKLQRNVKKFQERFILSKTIREIEDFYEKIIAQKNR